MASFLSDNNVLEYLFHEYFLKGYEYLPYYKNDCAGCPNNEFKSPAYNKNVKPDGIGTTELRNEKNKIVGTGIAFFEVKNAGGSSVSLKTYLNIPRGIDALANLSRGNKAMGYFLITPSNVKNTFGIRDYAKKNNVNFNHYVPFIDRSGGEIRVKFMNRTQFLTTMDINLPNYNPLILSR